MGSRIGKETIEISTNGMNLRKANAVTIKVGEEILHSNVDVAHFNTKGRYNLTLTDNRNYMSLDQPTHRVAWATLNIHVADVDLEIGFLTGKGKRNSLDFRAKHFRETLNQLAQMIVQRLPS